MINDETRLSEGYNECPKCGRTPHEMMFENDVYLVGCAYCGIRHGVVQFLEEPLNDKIREAVKKEWNTKCLNATYEEMVLEEFGIKTGDYVVTYRNSDKIFFSTSDFDAVLSFAEQSGESYNIYRANSKELKYLGSLFYSN